MRFDSNFDSNDEIRRRMRRERDAFDRTWKWLWPVGLVVSLAFIAAWIVILAGGAAWLWGHL